jgi:hypothetical protein
METVTSLLRYCLARNADLNFLLLRSIADVAAMTVQIERAERYTVEKEFFCEEVKNREDSAMVRLHIQPIMDQINRLYERRRRDIRDIERHLRQPAGSRRPSDEQEGANLAQRMMEFLQKAKPLLYASLISDAAGEVSPENWTYPGDTPEEAERCRREARRILSSLQKNAQA